MNERDKREDCSWKRLTDTAKKTFLELQTRSKLVKLIAARKLSMTCKKKPLGVQLRTHYTLSQLIGSINDLLGR